MDAAEYERRKEFCTALKDLGRSGWIEIARILRKYDIPLSENRSGIYFDMAKLPANVFEELLQFQQFVIQNTKELEKRDIILHDMVAATATSKEGETGSD